MSTIKTGLSAHPGVEGTATDQQAVERLYGAATGTVVALAMEMQKLIDATPPGAPLDPARAVRVARNSLPYLREALACCEATVALENMRARVAALGPLGDPDAGPRHRN